MVISNFTLEQSTHLLVNNRQLSRMDRQLRKKSKDYDMRHKGRELTEESEEKIQFPDDDQECR